MSDAGPPQTTSGDQPGNGPFPVVGVGASAGGLEAFTQLLSALPDNTGMAFVLVQHLDPKHESSLSELLAKVTRMPVVEAMNGLAVCPDQIYVIPPNTTLTIAQGVLQLTPRGEARGPHLPIDQFFKALAEDRQTGAIGVILSGSGTDGTLGLEEIKASGGITFAQDEQSAKYAGMPQSAIRSGCVDLVLPPNEIARELARLGQHPYLAPAPTEERAPAAVAEEDHFKEIMALLRSSFGVDFSAYRDTTIKRRIMRRMVLHTHGNLTAYARHLEEDRAEVGALYQDILINVTSFFREPETFEALKRSVFPEITQGKNPNTPIRIWVPGCSTGQEAYSLAIALLEYLEEKPVKPAIQIFATDLSDTISLQKAREGIYPENIEAELSPERLRRFFTKEDSRYRASKAIREVCVFAKQNVAADPPFSRLDLISCRNLLIYLSPALQKRVIQTLHYALNPSGFLVLGASETIGAFTDLFGVADQKHRIYVKKATAARQYPYFSAENYQATASGRGAPTAPVASPADWQREADRIALGQYAPPGVLVNENFDVLQYRGDTGPYLAPAPGEPSHNLLKMARAGLFMELRAALIECRQKGAAVHRQRVRVRGEGLDREIDLHVLPVKLPHAGNHCFLVLFEETVRRVSAPQEAPPEPVKDEDGSEAALLRQELASTREYLQSVIEQQDAANEELKSANEEILSSNEELQSTNEELETAKEELQSMNEEVTTVNEQLQNRNQELSRLSDALTNLQASANVAMVELGIDLRLRRFTPAAAKLLNLLPGDVGRPIGNLKMRVEVPDLETLVTEVIDTVQVKEREVRDRDGRWYALRIHPYRTAENKIDGAVAVLVDIDEAKSAQEKIRKARDYAEAIVETVRDPLLVLDKELRAVSANQAFYQLFQVTPAETEGRFIYEIGNRQWDIAELRHLLEEMIPQKAAIKDFEIRHNFPTIGPKVMLLNARRIVHEGQETELILLAIEDVTERVEFQAALRISESRFRRLFESAKDGILIINPQTRRIVDANPFITELLGYTREELIGTELFEIGRLKDEQAGHAAFRELQEKHYIHYENLPLETKAGERREVEVVANLYREDSDEVIQCNIRDITERRRLEDDQRRLTEQLREADRQKNEFLAMLAHELRNPLAPLQNCVEILNRVGSQDALAQQARGMMERQIQHMTRLIDDLLDLSRIISGKIDLRKKRLDLAAVVKQVVEICRPTVDAAGQELTVEVLPEPLMLQADPVRVAQIVQNLLTNAIKYTDRDGRIELVVEREKSEAVLRVRDSGIGIAAEMLPRIWDLFMQVDPQSSRSRVGLGIGLTLVRNLVELHGGTTEAKSGGLGQGSEFIVRLPLAPDMRETEVTPALSPTELPAPPPLLRRILVVDDDADEAESLGTLLKLMGHEVRMAHDGPVALEVAARFRPAVVFLDIAIPGMSGYEIARRLRQELGLDAARLIALTGYGTEEDRRRTQEAGFDSHLIKPASLEAVQALLVENR
jgi:two-component system CheB/CheR fusion protein